MEMDSIKINQLEEKISVLQKENARLKALLDKAGIDYSLDEQKYYKKEMYDPNQGDRIIPVEITHNHARRFFSYFWVIISGSSTTQFTTSAPVVDNRSTISANK